MRKRMEVLQVSSESLSINNIITLRIIIHILNVHFRKRGNPNDEDWFGSDNRKYMVKKSKGGNKSMFRTNSRGSKKKVTKTPELLKHGSSPDDPPVSMKQFLVQFIFHSIQNLNY